jgi:hypothetical protein
MRYGDGGEVGPQGRARREQIRRQAAGMFREGMSGAQVAAALEISTKSVYAWRRAWTVGGDQALASKGAPGPDPVLSHGSCRNRSRNFTRGRLRPAGPRISVGPWPGFAL